MSENTEVPPLRVPFNDLAKWAVSQWAASGYEGDPSPHVERALHAAWEQGASFERRKLRIPPAPVNEQRRIDELRAHLHRVMGIARLTRLESGAGAPCALSRIEDLAAVGLSDDDARSLGRLP